MFQMKIFALSFRHCLSISNQADVYQGRQGRPSPSTDVKANEGGAVIPQSWQRSSQSFIVPPRIAFGRAVSGPRALAFAQVAPLFFSTSPPRPLATLPEKKELSSLHIRHHHRHHHHRHHNHLSDIYSPLKQLVHIFIITTILIIQPTLRTSSIASSI